MSLPRRMPNRWHALLRRRGAGVVLWSLLAAAGFAFYAWGAPENPPGFFIDESSIAYNAHTVARSGEDEHGESWPLYFRAFGDYKNPVYVYLLAAVFRVTGPSVGAARYLSAALGVLAALALGLLGARVGGEGRAAGPLTYMTALLTPWLFELSRLVLEVAAYPLAVALVLLCVRRVSEREAWPVREAAASASALALVTYTYSTGRLFGPLLALGLALLATTGARLRGLLTTWALYALALAPLLAYHLRHPEALTKRFGYLTYVTPETGYGEAAWEFAGRFAVNLSPRYMFFEGDPNEYQIVHMPGAAPLAGAVFALALVGLWLALRGARRDGWRRFLLYGLAASVVPASLTNDHFHMLRLAALPVFVVALAAHGWGWLVGRVRPGAVIFLAALVLAQGVYFRAWYGRAAQDPWRRHMFDADYPARLLPAALGAAPRGVLLADSTSVPGYIQAYWYGAARGLPRETFRLLAPDAAPPDGSVVITTEDTRPRCRLLAESEPYAVCLNVGEPRTPAPLPEGAFRAEFRAVEIPGRAAAKERFRVRVAVRNAGEAVWHAAERGLSPYRISAANHWLGADGRAVTNDDGRGALPRDLRPGEEAEITFQVNAPRRPGDYLLELDMLQEGVSWFALKGSPTLRVPVSVR